MIKPEDVPFELVGHYLQSRVGSSWPEKIASDLNAAIEAGLVVPASEAKVLRRALALLRTIRSEGYMPGRAGSIAIEQRIKELESEENK